MDVILTRRGWILGLWVAGGEVADGGIEAKVSPACQGEATVGDVRREVGERLADSVQQRGEVHSGN